MKLPDPQACWLACRKGKRRKPEQPTAHGEVPSEAFSDGGSTPPASTKGKALPYWAGLFLWIKGGCRTGAGVNGVPGARQSRDPACAAAQVDSPRLHQSENPVDECRRDFRFVLFILQFSVFIIHFPDKIY